MIETHLTVTICFSFSCLVQVEFHSEHYICNTLVIANTMDFILGGGCSILQSAGETHRSINTDDNTITEEKILETVPWASNRLQFDIHHIPFDIDNYLTKTQLYHETFANHVIHHSPCFLLLLYKRQFYFTACLGWLR